MAKAYKAKKTGKNSEPSTRLALSRRLVLVTGVTMFLLGGLAGWALFHPHNPLPDDEAAVEVHASSSGGLTYINPVLECANVEWQELRPFRSMVVKKLQQEVESGRIDDYALYFRDLNNGWWFGVNEKTIFQQGSLIKVPLLMAFLRQAETEPEILQRRLTCERDVNSVIRQNIVPGQTLAIGTAYPVEELLRRMIVYSDNAAMDTLVAHTQGEEWFRQLYHELALPAPGSDSPGGDITVKRYASFFRILYNATYLSREKSNQALQLLTETEFNNGLVAGIPPEVRVAHKFGERGDANGRMQLHDCGIVYYPQSPYLVCIMTRGRNQPEMARVIAETSKLIYANVTGQFTD